MEREDIAFIINSLKGTGGLTVIGGWLGFFPTLEGAHLFCERLEAQEWIVDDPMPHEEDGNRCWKVHYGRPHGRS